MSESDLMREIMMAVSKEGATIWRNNVGMLRDATGRLVKYGVANPGGADLIGFIPIQVGGRMLARFMALEVKLPAGKVTEPQQHFVDLIARQGGISGIPRSVAEAVEIVRRARG